MMKKARVMKKIVALVALLVSPALANAQFDHMQCYKVRDSAKFDASATLDALQSQFDIGADCSIKGARNKGKRFCVPVSKTVTAFEDKSRTGIPQVDLDGQEQFFDSICYKVKCPDGNIPPLLVTDQFGTRTIKDFKTDMLCVPAVKGVPTTTTTSTSTTTTTLPPVVCTDDVFQCVDGTVVSRDPDNDCEFFRCPCDNADCSLLKCAVTVCPDNVTFYGCTGECYEDPNTGEDSCVTPPSVCDQTTTTTTTTTSSTTTTSLDCSLVRCADPNCGGGEYPVIPDGECCPVCVTPDVCAGIAGLPCSSGLTCVENPETNCREDCANADCGGICVEAVPNAPCGGIAGLTCTGSQICVGIAGDQCDPLCGGADCNGICVEIPAP